MNSDWQARRLSAVPRGGARHAQVRGSCAQCRGARGLPAAFGGQRGSFFLSNPQPLAGSYNLKEGFVELEAPLLKGCAACAISPREWRDPRDRLQHRGIAYGLKIGGAYETFASRRFRATRSRDFPAANVSELFTGPVSIQGAVLYNNASTPPDRAPKRQSQPSARARAYHHGRRRLPPDLHSQLQPVGGLLDIQLSGAIERHTAQQTINQCNSGFAPASAQITNAGALILQIPTLDL